MGESKVSEMRHATQHNKNPPFLTSLIGGESCNFTLQFSQESNKRRFIVKKVMKIVGIVILVIMVVAGTAFRFYWHHNMHWYDKYEKALKKAGVVLEDPPVFSTEGEGWEQSFAYLDTYKPLHDWNESGRTECWESYYLRHCYWGQLYMADAMPGIADYAEKQHQKYPEESVKIGFLPSSIWYVFEYAKEYDFVYGERFYNLSWNHGLTHEEILSALEVPCVYIHAKENVHLETDTSDHVIHTAYMANKV